MEDIRLKLVCNIVIAYPSNRPSCILVAENSSCCEAGRESSVGAGGLGGKLECYRLEQTLRREHPEYGLLCFADFQRCCTKPTRWELSHAGREYFNVSFIDRLSEFTFLFIQIDKDCFDTYALLLQYGEPYWCQALGVNGLVTLGWGLAQLRLDQL